MSESKKKVWAQLRAEVEQIAAAEPILASFLYAAVLNHKTFEESLSFHLSVKLANPTIHATTLRDVMVECHDKDASIAAAAIEDLKAVVDRDPACDHYSTPFLFFKGYQALQSYRVAHYLWNAGRKSLALQLQSSISEVFNLDIHPASKIGRGIMIDHGTGVVVGETAVIEDGVSILHEVTLGGTGKEHGDRHPKIRRGVLLAAGAKIFGNIEIGESAKVAGGSVVLQSVPPFTTVAGVPAKPVGKTHGKPAKEMDQSINGLGDDPGL